MKNLCLILGIVVLSVACGPRGDGDIPVLDVTKTYPAKDLVLQDIAEVEYIPIETREGFLVDYLRPQYIDDEIVVTTNNTGDIMIFDRKTGKGITSFNRMGRGPGEYSRVGTVVVDKKAGEMFVTPGMYSSNAAFPIHVYDMGGKHLRTLEFGSAAYSLELHDYDAEHLFGYDPVPVRGSEPNPQPYALLSKRDTVVTPLPVRFEGRQTMMVMITRGEMTMATGPSDSGLTRSGDGYILSEPGIDTMWRWGGGSGGLTPLMVRTPAFASMEYPIALFCWGESRDHIFLQTIERRFDTEQGFDKVNLIYDKRAGEFHEGVLVNGDFADQRPFEFIPSAGVPAGVSVMALQSFELIDLHEQGKLTGRLAEIAGGLKEDDNPVMMIATFNQ